MQNLKYRLDKSRNRYEFTYVFYKISSKHFQMVLLCNFLKKFYIKSTNMTKSLSLCLFVTEATQEVSALAPYVEARSIHEVSIST